jgi:TatA/E family protein of Tat protein translocase
MDIGARELMIIAIVLVLLFSAKKIPQLAKGIADAIKELRNGFSGGLASDVTDVKAKNERIVKK